MYRSIALIFCLTLASLVGCASDTSPGIEKPPPEVVRSLAALQPADGCDDVAAALREQAIEEMEQRLSDNEQMLLSSRPLALVVLVPAALWWWRSGDTGAPTGPEVVERLQLEVEAFIAA